MTLRYVVCNLLIILGWSLHLSAFCSFRLFKAPNGKLILIIGDVFDEDKKFDCHVSTFINAVTEQKFAQPLEILAEIPDPLPKFAWKAAPSFERLHSLKLQVDRDPSSSLRFTSCEPRGFISELLETLRSELCQIALDVATDEDYKQAYDIAVSPSDRVTKPWTEIKARELARIEQQQIVVPITTVQTYLRSLIDKLDQLDNLCEIYHDTPKAKIFEEYRTQFLEARKIIIGVLDQFPLEADFFELLERACLSGETTFDMLTMLRVIDAIILEKTDYLFASAIMTDLIFKRCSSEVPICMIVSEAHAKNIATCLRELKWECLDGAYHYEKLSPLQYHFPKVPDFEERFKQVLAKTLEPLKAHSPVKASGRVCATCHTEKEKLVRCGQCKKSYYCDIECQRKDWATHKVTCQKVTVKV